MFATHSELILGGEERQTSPADPGWGGKTEVSSRCRGHFLGGILHLPTSAALAAHFLYLAKQKNEFGFVSGSQENLPFDQCSYRRPPDPIKEASFNSK